MLGLKSVGVYKEVESRIGDECGATVEYADQQRGVEVDIDRRVEGLTHANGGHAM